MVGYDSLQRKFIIDEQFCKECNLSHDNWNRPAVTPFAVACFVYQAHATLGFTGTAIQKALMTKWDRLRWGDSNIHINTWNDLFNGYTMKEEQWEKILFPFVYIDTIYTNVTSPNAKTTCHPVYFGVHQYVPDTLMICTDESYAKTMVNGVSNKITIYRYGQATGFKTSLLESLRKEVTRVIIPLTE